MAKLPIVFGGKRYIVLIIVVALGSKPDLARSSAAFMDIRRSVTLGVILANREMLGPEMPVDIDGAEAGLEEGGRDGFTTIGVEITLVAYGHIAACLLKGLEDAIFHALDIIEVTIS